MPYRILLKQQPLDADEWAVMRRHPEWGAEAIASVPGFQYIQPVQVEAAGVAADRRLGAANAGEVDVSRNQSRDRYWAAAHEDRFESESLVLEKAFGDGDVNGQLVVPREADEDDTDIFLLLGGGGRTKKQG